MWGRIGKFLKSLYGGVLGMWPFSSDPNRKKVIIRTNVLTLMLMAYATIFTLIVTLVLVFKADAFQDPMGDFLNLLGNALIALIGGTLAISKDLVNDDDEQRDREPGNGQGNQPRTE